jgi:hypothetical protein
MDNLLKIVQQELVEKQYSKKHIDKKIRTWLLEAHQAKIDEGVHLVKEYLSKSYYTSKNTRISQIKGMDLSALVLDIYVGVAYCCTPELFTSMTAQMAGKLKFSDKPEAIKTIAELVAVLCFTDVFDIFKPVGSLSLHIKFNLSIPPELLTFIQNTAFLPPMLCTPKEVTNNYSSGYLTHDDSLVLGKGNNHDGDLCLDVINKMNNVCLKLDTQFLSTLTETPTFMLDDQEKIDQWNKFIKQSYSFYLMLATHDNEFYLTHKVDKRGRIYAQGYHLNTQGTAFKKAMIELANEELVEGVY